MWSPCGLDVDLGSITWLMFVEMSLLPVLWLSLSNPYPVPVGAVDLKEKPQTAGGKAENGTGWQDERDDYYEQESYLGRDPAGPLAPLGGTESLLHSPPPKW
jgi:hypothetical protein